MTPYADQNESSPSLGAASCETVATIVGSSEAQRSLYADQNEASPPLGAAAAKLSSVSVAPGMPSRVVPPADQNEASSSLGSANCEAVASFGGSWEAQRSGATRRSE